MTPKVSVMIPVYNTAAYVGRCLTSLFEQTFDDIEYIIVNDATPDHAMDIVNNLVASYPHRRVKIIDHKTNKGSASARNTALDAASGEYLIYVDSDDWAEKNMIERMVSVAENEGADLVLADYYVDYKNRKTAYVSLADTIKENPNYKELFFSGKIRLFTWNKMISKRLYDNYAIRFIEGINMWEDVATIPRLAFFAQRIAYLPEAFVHYVQYNPGSYTASCSADSIKQMQGAIETLEVFWKEQGCDPQCKAGLDELKLHTKVSWFVNTRGKARNELMHKYPEVNSLRNKVQPFYRRCLAELVRRHQYRLADCLVFVIKQSKKVIFR